MTGWGMVVGMDERGFGMFAPVWRGGADRRAMKWSDRQVFVERDE